MKAATSLFFSEDGFKLYKELRKEIVGSHAIEVTGEEKIQLLKEDRKEHNRKAAQGIRNMVKG